MNLRNTGRRRAALASHTSGAVSRGNKSGDRAGRLRQTGQTRTGLRHRDRGVDALIYGGGSVPLATAYNEIYVVLEYIIYYVYLHINIYSLFTFINVILMYVLK